MKSSYLSTCAKKSSVYFLTPTYNQMKQVYIAAIIVFLSHFAIGQDTLSPAQRIIEDAIEQLGEESDFDFNTQFEHLETYLKKPLNLNIATAEELFEFGLLTPPQINALIEYRRTVGNLSIIEELQAVPLFDINTIQAIQSFVTVKNDVSLSPSSIKDLFNKGNHSVLIRSRRILEAQKGFQIDEQTGLSNYIGSPYQLYSRYKYNFDTRLSYGVTVEKDIGERFFNSVYGFDFYSAHFYLHNLNERVKDIAVGDYELRFGQGLLMWSGLGFGKSSFVSNIKRVGRRVKSYTSVSEFAFLRGGATTISLTDKLDLTAFISYKNRDANISAIDTIDMEVLEVSSLQTSGLHRTTQEISDKNAIQEFVTGGSLKYQFSSQNHIAANVVYTQFSSPLVRNNEPYNLYRFQDSALVNGSLDYSYVYKNLNFFGETALSDNGGLATIHGLLVSLESFIDLAILQRYFAPDYQTIYSNTFSETTGTNNEQGIYLGLQIKPSKKWQYSFYFDTWKHPWLRFQLDAPGHGYEYFGQVTYQPQKGTQVYWQFRNEIKSQNFADEISKTNYLVEHRKINTRLHFQTKISNVLEWRSRLTFSFYDDAEKWSKGVLLYQDLIFSPLDFPLSASVRLALFDTDNYDTRIYAYENDLLYSFSVPPFYNRGSRFYLNLRYKGIRNLTVEARLSQTRINNQTTIGSGWNEINDNQQTEVKFQIQYKF
jgi:hypothetical protein